MAIGIAYAATHDDVWDMAVDVTRTYTIATNGVVDNITGYTGVLNVWTHQGGSLLASLTASVTGPSGIMAFALPDTTSALWSAVRGVYEWDITDGAGLKERMIRGALELRHSGGKAI